MVVACDLLCDGEFNQYVAAMISIIVCSVNPMLAKQFMESVSSTIGVECEFVIYDNRDSSMGIAAVYNHCAERAKYEMLCFAHEDVLFNTQDWGKKIARQLLTERCGVIGFAGSTVKSRAYSGWGQRAMYNRCNYTQHFADGRKRLYTNVDKSIEFERVVTLDGLALFVNKSVWNENRFDEKLLKNFHCYDIDFTLQVNSNYNNYICNCVDIEHLSTGSYNKMWLNDTMLLHDVKWGDKLPISLEELPPRRHRRNEREAEYQFVKRLVECEPDRAKRSEFVWPFVRRYWLGNGAIKIVLKHLVRGF